MICLLPCARTGGSLSELYKLSLEDHTDLLLVEGTRMRSCQTAALGPGFFLVHDSAQPHVAGMWQQVLDEGNPAPLGHCVLLNHRYITPQTVQELTDEPIQVWEEIPKGLSVRSISRCCTVCILYKHMEAMHRTESLWFGIQSLISLWFRFKIILTLCGS